MAEMTSVSQIVLSTGQGGSHVKKVIRSQAFRVLLALGTIASSAAVLEAGRRWF
jgi:hypothetical protein